MNTRIRSRLKKAARNFKRIDFAAMPLAQLPDLVDDTFGPMERLLVELETTGDIDADHQGAVYRAPGDHTWYSLAGAIVGFVEFFISHEKISGRPMPIQALWRLANKFSYGMMVFQSDIDDVRLELTKLKTETMLMTSGQARAIIQKMTEAK